MASNAAAAPAPAPAPKKKTPPSHFFVQYCRSCDGGNQERTATIRFIQEVFPGAKVTAAYHRSYPNSVVVNVGTEKSHKPLVAVKQRDLYSKYRWPAKATIVKALKTLQ